MSSSATPIPTAPTPVAPAIYPLTYDADAWTCPDTKVTIPKTLEANLVFRQALMFSATSDTKLQGELMAICTRSPLFLG